MRRIPLLAVATGIFLLGSTLFSISPAAAASSITVTPNADLKRALQSVHVDGAGWPGSVGVGVCQAVINGTPDQNDCAGGFGVLVNTDADGHLSLDLGVQQIVSIPSLGRTVDCGIESCYVAAAVFSDIAHTAVFTPITFSKDLADGRIKRRSDGTIFGDNVYDFGPGELAKHTIAPGGTWTYALQVQNDGPTTTDLTVSASVSSTEGLTGQVQFFVGYYDVTSYVLSPSGLTFTDMAPGEVRTFALRFGVPADAPAGSYVNAFVGFASATAGQTDALSLYVNVPTAT